MTSFIFYTSPFLQVWERWLFHLLKKKKKSTQRSKMKKKRNMFQIKGQNKTSGKKLE